MDRTININVNGEFVKKDNKNAGVQGEANATKLHITMSADWEQYSNVYNANFAPRPALMEHRVQVPRPGESRGPSSKEAISCRGKLHGGRSEPGRTHGIDADGPDTGGRPPGTSMEGGAASYQRCPALLRIQTE